MLFLRSIAPVVPNRTAKWSVRRFQSVHQVALIALAGVLPVSLAAAPRAPVAEKTLAKKAPFTASVTRKARIGLAKARRQIIAVPPGATVLVKVAVPASMRSAPFNVDRYLNVPPNFTAEVYARVGGARFMAFAPNGDLFVSVPSAGTVYLVRPKTTGDPTVSKFVSGLRNPHDIVFHSIGATTYVYISESHQINRFIYKAGDTTAHDRQVVVAKLPDGSSPELRGAYGHQLKNIVLDQDDKLYVAIASATNADPSDTTSNPVRCAIYQYNADGTNGRLFARGLRNPEGLAILPDTNELWVTVNNRDQTRYPLHDGKYGFGELNAGYVDNHPPDEFTRVVEGANYGWPFANPNPDTPSGMDNPPFDPDYDNNRDWSRYPETTFTRVTKGIQAHSAAIGLIFTHETKLPQAYLPGAIIALHGSWNRQVKTGYKVIFFPFNPVTQLPGSQVDLVTGWLNDATQAVWGRPVDVAADAQGRLLVSDDTAGAIYRLTYNPAPAAPSNLVGKLVASSAAQLTWTDNATNETGFRIWRSTDGINFVSVGTVAVNAGNFVNTRLAPNKWYSFRVTAYTAASESAPSSTVSVRTPNRR